MLSIRKRRIMKSALKCRCRDSSRVKWWLKDESVTPVAQSVATAIMEITNQTVPSNTEIIKSSERKSVFRMEHPQHPAQSFIAKVFLLNRFEHRLKYYKYGLDETANLIRAKARGINSPEVYGYGHIYDMLGLVKVSIIILEDLRHLSPIGVLMRAKSEDERSRVFMRTVPLFVRLYEAGCNHIDVNSGAVMLSDRDLDSKVFLLDFQHAKFYDRPSSEILMFEAGRFAKSCRNWVSDETIGDWLADLFAAIGLDDSDERRTMRERFEYYFDTHLSRKEGRRVH